MPLSKKLQKEAQKNAESFTKITKCLAAHWPDKTLLELQGSAWPYYIYALKNRYKSKGKLFSYLWSTIYWGLLESERAGGEEKVWLKREIRKLIKAEEKAMQSHGYVPEKLQKTMHKIMQKKIIYKDIL